jgi:hypothetical protein
LLGAAAALLMLQQSRHKAVVQDDGSENGMQAWGCRTLVMRHENECTVATLHNGSYKFVQGCAESVLPGSLLRQAGYGCINDEPAKALNAAPTQPFCASARKA